MSYSFKSVVLFLKILVTLVLSRGYGCIIHVSCKVTFLTFQLFHGIKIGLTIAPTRIFW